jgi:hypothetical protein
VYRWLRYRFRRFNPNEIELEERLELGRSRALTVEQLAVMEQDERGTNWSDVQRAPDGIPCEHCGELVFLPSSSAGKVELCPHCSEYIDVPVALDEDPSTPSEFA